MLDDHQVVPADVLADQPGCLALGMQGIQGQHHPGQVQSRDGRSQLGDLVGLGVHFPLRQRAAVAHVEDR